jgi:hypothetical protein
LRPGRRRRSCRRCRWFLYLPPLPFLIFLSKLFRIRLIDGRQVIEPPTSPTSPTDWPAKAASAPCSASGTRACARERRSAIRVIPSGRPSSPDITLDEALFCMIQEGCHGSLSLPRARWVDGPAPESEPAYRLGRLARLEPKVGSGIIFGPVAEVLSAWRR